MDGTEKPRLLIEGLHERHAGLTPALGGTFSEAARVCLSRHHQSPVELSIANPNLVAHIVEYSSPDSRTMNAWANDIDTTESGAYGICLAAVEAVESLVAVRRAETLTGADWYVAPIGTDPQDLELCFRLEVSGVDAGGKSVVDARLRQKVEQTRKGNSNVPAIASVVGFKELTVAIQRVGDSQ
nr:hypothetical protein [uncultured Rhodoferax sp.]